MARKYVRREEALRFWSTSLPIADESQRLILRLVMQTMKDEDIIEATEALFDDLAYQGKKNGMLETHEVDDETVEECRHDVRLETLENDGYPVNAVCLSCGDVRGWRDVADGGEYTRSKKERQVWRRKK